MLLIGDKLVSIDIIEHKFSCNLDKCKGACCVQGDSGAPLTLKEIKKLKSILKKLKPYLPEENFKILKKSVYQVDREGDYVTTLRDGKECAFAVFNDKGIARCAIEKAFLDGKIDFRKPLSCHLYPIRVTELKEYTAINYHEWDICKGSPQTDDYIFKYLKEPLIRAYGEEWYNELKTTAEEYLKQKNNKK